MFHRSLLTSLAAISAALSLSVPAVAGDPYYGQSGGSPLYGGATDSGGWFLGVRGSALWLEDIGYLTTTRLGPVGLEADFEVGWGVTIPFGYQFSNGFALGGSAGYYTAGIDEISILHRGRHVAEVGLDADVATIPLLLNASYSFRLTETFSLTLGAGAGLAWSELDIDNVRGRDYDLSVDDWDFSFQGFGSFNFMLTRTTDLTLGYRYIQAETREDALQGHNLEAGITIKF